MSVELAAHVRGVRSVGVEDLAHGFAVAAHDAAADLEAGRRLNGRIGTRFCPEPVASSSRRGRPLRSFACDGRGPSAGLRPAHEERIP